MHGFGTAINIITVLIGTTFGLLLRSKLNEAYQSIILQGIGLLTIVIGMQMALKTENILVLLASVVLGGLLGQYIRIDYRLERLAGSFKKKYARDGDTYFSEGFITASIIFCVGPMTILGSLNDGLYGNYDLLALKSVLDGFTSIALAASFGIGVIFSIVTIIVVQGGITFAALFIEQALSNMMVTEMTAVGGVLIVGIGIVILNIKKINVANFLPAIILAPMITALYQYVQSII